MLWIVFTAAAAPLQIARNALQRGLVGDAGPWGATLVRFLFGLPFSLATFAVVAMATPGAGPHLSLRFAAAVSAGSVAQVAATAALLMAMRHSGFAVATFMQQSSLPLAAIMGFTLFGDRMSVVQWVGLAATTAGLLILSWPKTESAGSGSSGALYGLASGLAFAVALNVTARPASPWSRATRSTPPRPRSVSPRRCSRSSWS
jgi:drug/metabolite transporter (DMT)-like permease